MPNRDLPTHETIAAPGMLTNAVHPGDPIQQLGVAGFVQLADALAFIEQSVPAEASAAAFAQRLDVGATMDFSAATFLVISAEENGKRRLLTSMRVHSDLYLVANSCGYHITVRAQPVP